MNDQAQQLREKLLRQSSAPSVLQHGSRKTKVVAVASGKGGVGKSNVALNFALGLLQEGQRVVVMDLDVGFGNIDVLLGISSQKNIVDLIDKGLSIWDIIEKGPNGLQFIAGGSGLSQIFQLDEKKLQYFFEQLALLQGYADVIILDIGAGISEKSLRFLLAADEILIVTTPEPTALTDAYALIKMTHSRKPGVCFRVVVNRAASAKEGKFVADKLSLVSRQFLGLEVFSLGFMFDDVHVTRAVKKQQPFSLAYPSSKAAHSMRDLVRSYLQQENEQKKEAGMKGFISRLRSFWK
ncbi:MinD/ParA family protein [Aneurinibacillus uraniidurans]|uniref:MinD/ParA family protein n=1 Tax=Aneurinibacillus uraniidurans TaxID=2966586 RepID=UPI002349A846|nr:MinD/ParA family protein [Aneurinibacillus sp. B1]WCN39110.1 MinD/ParA family protein [Aneurinibacillus sp. B1]